MTDAGERVVLREERDRWSGRADASAKGRLEAADTHLHSDTVALEQRGDACRGATLLIRKLRIVMDLAGESHQLVSER
jgi:hypothetical protein